MAKKSDDSKSEGWYQSDIDDKEREILNLVDDASEAMMQYNYPDVADSPMMPYTLMIQGRDLVDFLLSEDEVDQDTVASLFSESTVYEAVASDYSYLPTVFQVLGMLGRLLNYQYRTEGRGVMLAHTQTMLAGDMLNQLCATPSIKRLRKLKEHDFADGFSSFLVAYMFESAKVFLMVGEKKRFGERIRCIYNIRKDMKELSPVEYFVPRWKKLSEHELWDSYRKKFVVFLRLACIFCGKYEKTGEVKLSLCGGCGNSFYCSKKCQKIFWKFHKKRCKKASEEAK